MISLVLPILVAYQGVGNSSAPAGLICFAVSNSSSTLPVKDVLELKTHWKSKAYVKLLSGNYGVFRNGCYFIVSKDIPLLKGLRDRFELASKIIELAKDGRSKICQVSIKGQELSGSEIDTLIKLVDQWSGMQYSPQELLDQGPMKFVFNSVTTYSSGGESFSVYPRYSYPTEEFKEFVRANVVMPGVLTELSAQKRQESLTKNMDNPITGNEITDGAVSIRVFNALTEKPDTSSCQKEILEQVDRIYQDEFREYQEKISKSTTPIRKLEEYLFKDFDSTNVSETDESKNRSDLMRQLRGSGYSSQDAESRLKNLKPTGKNIVVSMQTRIKSFGFDVSKFSITVRIWP